MTVSGTATVRFNNTGSSQLIPGTSDTLPDGARGLGGSLTLAALGQALSGSFTFDQGTTIEGDPILSAAFSDVSVNLGGAGFVRVSQANGLVLLTPDGLAGRVTASVALTTPNASLGSGTFAVALNTTGHAVRETATTAGSTVDVDLPGGPFLRVEATGARLTVSDQSLSGDFAFEQTTTSAGASVVRVAASNVSMSLGDGTTAFVAVAGGRGVIVLTGAGAAGTLAGAVAVNVPQVSLSGAFHVDVNTLGSAVDQTVTSGGIPTRINLPAGPFVRVAGAGTQFQILGQTLSGDFSFSQANASTVQVAAANASLALGDGTTALVSIRIASGTLAITSSGLTATLSGSAATTLPGLAFSGAFGVAIDTASGFVHVTAANAGLAINGQTFGGNFTLEQATAQDGTRLVRLGVSALTFALGDGTHTYVSVTDGQGSFLLSRLGVAAAFSVTASLSGLPGVTASGTPTATIEVNTTATAVDETLAVAGQPVVIRVPGGPFVRVEVAGVTLGLVGGATLAGAFTFDRSLASGANPITRFAVRSLSASLGGVTLSNGEGAFVVEPTGLAGFASGTVGASGGGFSAGGSIGLRMNKTGNAVNETIDLGGRSLSIRFADGTDQFHAAWPRPRPRKSPWRRQSPRARSTATSRARSSWRATFSCAITAPLPRRWPRRSGRPRACAPRSMPSCAAIANGRTATGRCSPTIS